MKEPRVREQTKEQRASDMWLLLIGPLVAPSARSLLLFCSVTLDHLPCMLSLTVSAERHPGDVPPPPVCLSNKTVINLKLFL